MRAGSAATNPTGVKAPIAQGQLVSITALAMVAVTANSVLARLALAEPDIDPGIYTVIRLAAGTIFLLPLVYLSRGTRPRARRQGLLAIGYRALHLCGWVLLRPRLPGISGTGALILFGVVQAVIIGTALLRGDRPGRGSYLGLPIALLGLVYLVAPGISAPDPVGTVLMTIAGVGWAFYTLRGRSGADPVVLTGANFLLSLVFCTALGIIALTLGVYEASAKGAVLAATSGAIASGLGDSLRFAVLPRLTRAQAGVIWLSPVPLAAAGGLLLLDEPLKPRLAVATVFILGGGVALGILTPDRRLL